MGQPSIKFLTISTLVAAMMKAVALLETTMRSLHMTMTRGPTTTPIITGPATPITTVTLFGRVMHVKRDDICCGMSPINGNKARKLRYLIDTDEEGTTGTLGQQDSGRALASCGGYQSNAMLALAMIAMSKNISFYYLTREIPSHVKDSSEGNLHTALSCGMQCIELSAQSYSELLDWSRSHEAAGHNSTEYLSNVLITRGCYNRKASLTWIPQGCATSQAKKGLHELAREIDAYIRASQLPGPWKIYFASGTGTTAYFVSQYFASSSSSRAPPCTPLYPSSLGDTSTIPLPRDVTVVAIPCVGDETYLLQQMLALDASCGGNGEGLPTVLRSRQGEGASLGRKRRFGQLCADHLLLWRRIMEHTNIEFDLIYTPRAIEIMLLDAAVEQQESCNDDPLNNAPLQLQHYESGCNIMYYHCGGVEGNPTQLSRYKFMKLS